MLTMPADSTSTQQSINAGVILTSKIFFTDFPCYKKLSYSLSFITKKIGESFSHSGRETIDESFGMHAFAVIVMFMHICDLATGNTIVHCRMRAQILL